MTRKQTRTGSAGPDSDCPAQSAPPLAEPAGHCHSSSSSATVIQVQVPTLSPRRVRSQCAASRSSVARARPGLHSMLHLVLERWRRRGGHHSSAEGRRLTCHWQWPSMSRTRSPVTPPSRPLAQAQPRARAATSLRPSLRPRNGQFDEAGEGQYEAKKRDSDRATRPSAYTVTVTVTA